MGNLQNGESLLVSTDITLLSRLATSRMHLTNKFHIAVCLFSNRSQITSKSVPVMFLPYFDVLRDLLLNRCTATWNAFVLYNKETNFYSSFISKSFSVTRKPAFATNTRKAVWRNLLFIKAILLVAMRSKDLWQVQKNHATVNLSRGMKTERK